MPAISKFLIFSGLLLLALGLLTWAMQGRFDWFGRLPGDIRIERENFRFYAPIVTMLLLSIVISLIIRLFQRFF